MQPNCEGFGESDHQIIDSPEEDSTNDLSMSAHQQRQNKKRRTGCDQVAPATTTDRSGAPESSREVSRQLTRSLSSRPRPISLRPIRPALPKSSNPIIQQPIPRMAQGSQLVASGSSQRTAPTPLVLENIRHGPTNLPPQRYATPNSPWKPKKPRQYSTSMEPEALDELNDRMRRLETAVDHYIDRRGQNALARAIVPGMKLEEEEEEEEEEEDNADS